MKIIGSQRRYGFKLAAIMALGVWLMTGAVHAKTYKLQVDGLACPFCSYGIEKQLSKLSGVRSVETSIKTGTVTVRTKNGHKLTRAELRAAVKRAGFTLRGLK